MPDPMTPERLAEIADQFTARLADLDAWIEQRATVRASEKIQAGKAVAQRHVDEARAEMQRQADLTAELRRHVAALDKQVTRLRPMEAALADVRELHASVPCNHPDGSNGSCCSHCCYTSIDTRSSYCHNPGPCWPCPTRAALDGGAGDGK